MAATSSRSVTAFGAIGVCLEAPPTLRHRRRTEKHAPSVNSLLRYLRPQGSVVLFREWTNFGLRWDANHGTRGAATGAIAGSLVRWLRPPVSEDEAKTHEAFSSTSSSGRSCSPLFRTSSVLIRARPTSSRGRSGRHCRRSRCNVVLLVLRRGHVRAASILQVCALFLFMTVSAATDAHAGADLRETGYPVVIIIAGVLLGDDGCSR